MVENLLLISFQLIFNCLRFQVYIGKMIIVYEKRGRL